MDSLKPVGRVVITDKNTGEVLVDKNNMILKNGREFLARLFGWNAFKDKDGEDIHLTEENTNSLYSLLLLDGISFPVYTDSTLASTTYANESTTAREILFKKKSGGDGNVSLIIDDKDEFPYLLVEVNYSDSHKLKTNGGNLLGLGTICLVLKNINQSSEVISYSTFSQICFDVIPITADTSLDIRYYIYF